MNFYYTYRFIREVGSPARITLCQNKISMTVPEQMMHPLDQKIVERHYQSHSQAVVDMINKHVIAGHTEHNAVMVDISILFMT